MTIEVTDEQCEAFIKTFLENEWQGRVKAIRLGLAEAMAIRPARVTFNELAQKESLAYVRNSYTPWTKAEIEVLMDPRLTLIEKAKKLNRSYYAVQSKYQKIRGRR